MEKCIITLGREFCTGGKGIAEQTAKALGISFYDKELITMAAQNSGLSEEAVAAFMRWHAAPSLSSGSERPGTSSRVGDSDGPP